MVSSRGPDEGPDWASLPANIVDLIAEKLTPPLSQFVWLGAVCKPWHAAIVENRQLHRKVLKGSYQLPLLMIPTPDKSEEKRALYNIMENKKSHNLELSVPYKRRCSGSSHGWLAVVADPSFAIKLINPFTGDVIDLPSIEFQVPPCDDRDESFLYDYFIKKVILSDDPRLNPDNYLVAALVGAWASIAIIRPGDHKSWTYSLLTFPDSLKEAKCDAIFLKDQIYAVDWRHGIMSIDLSSNKVIDLDFEEILVIPPKSPEVNLGYLRTYIVESSSSGDLLVVQREYGTEDMDDEPGFYCYTRKFEVYKLLRLENEAKLIEVKSLGDEALFLGDNQSMSVVASQFPGCQSNSIYFTDDNIDFGRPIRGPNDMGIFGLDNGCFVPHYDTDPSHKDMPPPFWILPTLQYKN